MNAFVQECRKHDVAFCASIWIPIVRLCKGRGLANDLLYLATLRRVYCYAGLWSRLPQQRARLPRPEGILQQSVLPWE